MQKLALSYVLATLAASAAGCGGWGSGSDWVKEPLGSEDERARVSGGSGGSSSGRRGPPVTARTIGDRREDTPETGGPAAGTGEGASGGHATGAAGGRVVGTFRNTYYDFPNEPDFAGTSIPLMNGKCEPIAQVARGFYDAVCVQGSGSLTRGGTVSFAKRDCACAEVCPRTGQRICFDALDKAAYPWGRGAAGTPIMPLRSIAADTKVLPMGTVLYLPELDGVAESDGCFVVEDRGLRVQGEHVDIFTGQPARTAAINARVPSNRGVTVVVDTPKCAHLARR